MAQPSISFQRGKGGLGRALPGEDYISSLIVYIDSLPTGFGTDNVKNVKSLEAAEDLGIVEGDANFGVLWYHISEYFRIQAKGSLFIGIYPKPADPANHTFDEVETVQNFAEGKVRQAAIFLDVPFLSTDLAKVQTVVTRLQGAEKPLNVLFAADIKLFADASTLPDLTSLLSPNVSVVIGQDGSAKGSDLYTSEGYSITTIGATLGTVSLSQVSESIAWVGKFNLTNGVELSTPFLANGQDLKDLSKSFLDGINDKAYIFIKNFVEGNGTFHNDSKTAELITSDFATIENNRTIDKAIRDINAAVRPLLNSPLQVDPVTGFISEDTIQVFKTTAETPLEVMAAAKPTPELSGFEVIIDPEQDVLATSKIEMSVNLVPMGTARQISINIGFTTQLTGA
jgi:hypothetical protein